MIGNVKKLTGIKNKFLGNILKHKKITALAVVILLIVLFFLRPKPSSPISTETAKKSNIVLAISITGTVSAEKSVDLSFLNSGKLVFLGVKKGDTVEQYQTIAALDQRSILKTLQDKLIDYSKQRNTFDQFRLDQQSTKPEDAVNDRLKRLLQNNQYDLNKSIISVELQDLVRQNSIIVSPIAGIVTRADVKSEGVNITSSTTFTITDPNELTFKMEVDEADISKVKEGQKVKVSLDSYPDKTLDLTVESIDFVTHITSTGGNAYDVKAKIDNNADYKYRVGMNGNAQIILAEKDNATNIPISSIVEGNKVFVKTSRGFEKRQLKIGLQNDTSAEVVSGLSEGDVVALEPSEIKQNSRPNIPFLGRFIRRYK